MKIFKSSEIELFNSEEISQDIENLFKQIHFINQITQSKTGTIKK